jgi:uncharacterized protein YbaR (Trm112 family)
VGLRFDATAKNPNAIPQKSARKQARGPDETYHFSSPRMDPEYLSILMCPKTKGSLRLASDAEVQQVNARIQADGAQTEPLQAGLVCDEGGLIYPVRDGIPVLLVAEAIPFGSPSDNPSPTESSA